MGIPFHRAEFNRQCVRSWALLWLLGLPVALAEDPPSLEGSDGIELSEVTLQSEGVLEVTFRETDESFAAFKTETTVNLSRAASAWTEVDGIEYEPLGDKQYKAAIPFDPVENRYFRIVGLGSALDLDGDGLSNEDETNTYGTNPNDPDSDDDGYSDSVEVAEGTDPNNANEFPAFSTLPAVRFALAKEVIEEGNYVHRITLESDKPLFGSVGYTVSALSTSDPESGGDLLLLSNAVEFSGNISGTIDISLTDDAKIEDVEALIIDLKDAVEGNYRVGSINRHILVIRDNDAFWTAQIIDGQSESSFRMRLIETNSQLSGEIVSGAGNGSGVIPEGEWNLTVARTDTTFEAVSEPIVMTDSLLSSTPLQRQLTITVAPPEDTGPEAQFAYFFRPDRMVGTLLDAVSGVDPGDIYLNQESLKVVVLVRDPPSFVGIDLSETSEP